MKSKPRTALPFLWIEPISHHHRAPAGSTLTLTLTSPGPRRLHPKNLEYLHGVVTNLLLDKAKFRGKDASPHVPQLLQLLERYDWGALLGFFSQS